MKMNICHIPQFPGIIRTFPDALLRNCYMASILKIGTSWRVQIRRKGHKPITETFPTKAMALEWSRKTETEIDAKRRTKIHGETGVKIADVIDVYLENKEDFGKTKVNVLEHLRGGLGKIAIDELTADDVIGYVKNRGYGPATAQSEMSILSTFLKVAKISKYHVPAIMEEVRESLKALGKLKKSRHRDRRPTADELKRLCLHFDKHSALPVRDLIWFSVHTAMRSSEVTRLRWDDYHATDKTIVIRDRKDPEEKIGNDQIVPLLDPAIEIIERQARDGELIFPYNAPTLSSIFPRACRTLGIVGLHWHDLRHEGVSRLFEMGYQIHEVALFSGHKDWAMLKRYTQLRAKDLRRL